MFELDDNDSLSIEGIEPMIVNVKNLDFLGRAKRLTVIAVVISAILCIGGIFFGIYQDNPLITAVWKGNDIVTLLVALPMILLAVKRMETTDRSHIVDLLIWLGGLWYLIYNYIFYVYGAAFNIFFLGYVAMVIFSTAALVFGLIHSSTRIDHFDDIRYSFKSISNFMFGFAMLLGLMWTLLAASYWFTQVVPIAITQTGHPTGVVFATDLIFLVFPLFMTAIFLRKGNKWAMFLTPVIMVKCCLYPLVFVAAGLLAYIETGVYDILTPIYLLFGFGCAWVLRVMILRLK